MARIRFPTWDDLQPFALLAVIVFLIASWCHEVDLLWCRW
jgi:hypothetical protein